MSSTFSPNLAIELIGTFDQAGSWGNTTNTNLGTLIEQAISGYVTQAVATGADTTITIPNGATGVARNMYIELTGTGGASTNLIVPANKKLYFIFNNTSSGQVTVKVSGQTGISVPNGKKMILVSNGTDIVTAENYVASLSSDNLSLTGTLAVGSTSTFTGAATFTANPTLSGGTANGVLYLNGSKVATSSADLTFTSTGLGIGTASPGQKLDIITDSNAFVGQRIRNNDTGSSAYAGLILNPNGNSWGIRSGSSAANSNALNFTVDILGTPSNLLTLTSSGNLGLGVTPSAWSGIGPVLQVEQASLVSESNDQLYLTANAYFAGGAWNYIASDIATQYYQAAGAHVWRTAPSGTAGNAITFTTAMTLDASGNLLVGGTSTAQLDGVFGQIIGSSTKSSAGIALETQYGAYMLYTDNADALIFWDSASNTERARIDSSGNVGLGVTPSAWGSNSKPLQAGDAGFWGSTSLTGYASMGGNYFYDGTYKYIKTGAATDYYQYQGAHAWRTAASGTAGNAISFTQAMTLDASGNLGLGATTTTGGRLVITQNNATQPAIYLPTDESTIQGPVTDTQIKMGNNLTLSSGGQTTVSAKSASGLIVFQTGSTPTERGRFSAGGYFKASDNGTYVGSTSAYHEFRQSANDNDLYVHATNASFTNSCMVVRTDRAAGTSCNYFYGLANGTNTFLVTNNGNVTNTNGSYGTISDAKMKTDIVDAGSQWDDIKAVRFRKFKMKDDPSGLMQLGVVAQELEQTSPGLVDEHTDRDAEGNDLGTTTKSVKTSVLLMKAAKALQEAMARIESLEADMAALKGAK